MDKLEAENLIIMTIDYLKDIIKTSDVADTFEDEDTRELAIKTIIADKLNEMEN